MTYSTELPEGFKTWNDYWKYLEPYADFEKGEVIFLNDDDKSPVWHSIEFVKSKCYDEIMELVRNTKDERFAAHGFVYEFQKLTHTKLFK